MGNTQPFKFQPCLTTVPKQTPGPSWAWLPSASLCRFDLLTDVHSAFRWVVDSTRIETLSTMIRRPPTQILLNMRDVEDTRVARERARAEAQQQQQQQQQHTRSQHGSATSGLAFTHPVPSDELSQQVGTTSSVVGETQLHQSMVFDSPFQSQAGGAGLPSQAQAQASHGAGPAGHQAESHRDVLERERRALPSEQRIMGT
ncbi:hypothetical protein V8E36_000483 [Tilletia maclaganii]